MKLTDGQKEAMAKFLVDTKPESLFKRIKGWAFSYIFAYLGIGSLACHEFFGGPEWVGNVGTFAFSIILALMIVGVILYGCMWILLEGGERKMFLFARIRNGGTYFRTFLRGHIFYIPAFAVIVPAGMWVFAFFTTVAYFSTQVVMYGIYKSAYDALDEEMKNPSEVTE